MLYAPTHLKQALWVLILAVMALAIACGSGEPATTAPSQPSPTATTQPESPPEPTAPVLPTEIPEVTEDASPAQPEITATPAGERGTPPERPQTRSEPTPGPQPETPAVEQPTAAPPPTAIPATAIPAAAPTYNPGPTSEYLYEETSAETDRTVLELFYERTTGEWWTNNENWMTEAPLGEWHGITTNAQGRVTEIRFDSNNLDGTLLPEIGNLSQLKVLHIRGNRDLTKGIPTEIVNLSQLEILDLAVNMIGGEIPPGIGNLSNLKQLVLSLNHLNGEIPPELANLQNLEWLDLRHNKLRTSRPPYLPEGFGDLPNITVLRISPQRPDRTNFCLPAKLRGQLSTDLPSYVEITPFCEE